MLLNMDTELQHLISISMDKMTSSANASPAGSGGRKSRGMDLRKALLVAHFLQEVRCAYFDEDYEIVANTIKHMQPTDEYEETDVKNYGKDEVVKNVDERCYEESRTYLMETDCDLPSSPSCSSVFQSCVTNADVTVSRISQMTSPLSVSINTNHVMSCQSNLDHGLSKAASDDDVEIPSICEELEVSACYEVTSSSYEEEELPRFPEVTLSEQRKTVFNAVNGATGGNTEVSEVEVASPHKPTSLAPAQPTEVGASVKEVATDKKTSNTPPSTCPLPKKKRPLPKEFLVDETDSLISNPVRKAVRKDYVIANEITKSSRYESVPKLNSSVTSIAHTVTLESRTSTSLSTVCSVMGTTSLYNYQDPSKYKQNPKVVVQMTQSRDSYVPITCSQIYLEKHLSDVIARSF